MTALTALIAKVSREALVACSRDGTITWADERARLLLGIADGESMFAYVAPGSDQKLRMALDGAAAGSTADWELVLLCAGTPATADVRAAADGDTVMLALNLAALGAGEQMDQMSAALNDLATIQRERERQQREIERRTSEVASLTRALDDSGRGITALYSELDDRAESLRTLSESRAKFLANMSHELRTPLSSIIGLTKLLLGRLDGDLTVEQERQIGYIRRAADDLHEMVTDLLDLSKMDAGHSPVRPREFSVEDLFGMLRGQMRPIAVGERVTLVFEEGRGFPALNTDEGKVAQVLRNFLTNALKFTTEGEVRLSARLNDGGTITFAVSDTGIGIAPEDQQRIFDEFTQLETPLHASARGTGLGLNIASRLASLLDGSVAVESGAGTGSTFTLTIPRVHPEASELAHLRERREHLEPGLAPVLVVEDDPRHLFLYERYLAGSGFQVVPARSIEEARETMREFCPAAIVLDVMLDGETTWQFLAETKRNPETCDVPVLVVTVLDRERKARALGADEFFVKPIDQDWLLRKLRTLAVQGPVERVLIIDDDSVARYVLRRLLAETPYSLIEAADGHEGVRMAREHRPDVIFLDFVLPSMTAFEVLDELKLDPATRSIPVIVSTSKDLDEEERQRLSTDTTAIISKDRLSREVAITRIRESLAKAIRGGAPADRMGVR